MSELGQFVLVSLPMVALLLYMLVEVARRPDLSVTRRVVWIVLLILVPVVALGVYIVVRPPRAAHITGEDADASRAEQIVVLAEARQRGELSDDDYHERVGAIASLD